MATIEKLNQKYCTGCGACFNCCPKGAISMKEDTKGFLAPVIDSFKCINCGLCAKTCPQLNYKKQENKNINCFGFVAPDEARALGGSGGFFPFISKKLIQEGWVIFGAAYEKGCFDVSIKKGETIDDVSKFFKSKYVQSNTKNTFKEVKEALLNDKKVLYSGCPCQIAGLKSFLGKDYKNLITIDILCHGAPSPLAYKKYLKEITNNKFKSIVNVDFRNKKYGWGKFISVDTSDGETIYKPHDCDYLRLFSDGTIIRESCFNCNYSNQNRIGDITIGDFWGIDEIDASLNDKKGISLVICNTKKGKRFYNKFSKEAVISRKFDKTRVLEVSRKNNGAINAPIKKPDGYERFFKHILKDSFNKSLFYSNKGLIDIGIVGWWVETPLSNYGSTLTDYALYQYLTDEGYSVAMISPPNFDRNGAGQFNKRYKYRMTAKYSPELMCENNKYIDTYIVASDVLWFYNAMIRSGYMFLLDFVDDSKKKISYSTSFGNSKAFFPQEELPHAKYLFNKFDFVSTREFEGVELCKKYFDITATQVLDPVFLTDVRNWTKMSDTAKNKTEGDFMFVYMLDPTKEKAEKLKQLSSKLDLKLVSITDKQFKPEEKKEILKDCGLLENAEIEDMIYHISNAKFIVTDSYHGFCFSLILNTPVAALVNRTRGGSRFDTLSELAKCKDRMFETMDEILMVSKFILLDSDYSSINHNLSIHRERSKKWLRAAIESSKRANPISKETENAEKKYWEEKTKQN